MKMMIGNMIKDENTGSIDPSALPAKGTWQ